MRVCVYLIYLVFSINVSAVNESELPTELNQLIALNLPLKDVLNFCSASKKFKEVCDSDFFWKTTLTRDFFGQKPEKEKDTTLTRKARYKEYSELVKRNVANLKDRWMKGGWMPNKHLSGAEFLVNADLSNLDLSKIQHDISLIKLNLTNANLSNTKFNEVLLNESILINANLTNANFNWVNFSGADLSNANLANVTSSSIHFFRSNLTNANLRGATFVLEYNGFLLADISGADFTDANIITNKVAGGKKIESLDDLIRAGCKWHKKNPPIGIK